MNKEKYINDINKLESNYGTLRSKWRRNLRMYCWSPTIDIDNLTDAQVVGYYAKGTYGGEDDGTSSITENVIKSCINTLVSKIASQKVRPFINTVNGSFKDMQISKQTQQYFDDLYDEQNINKVVADSFKDSCIFDRGVIYVNADLHMIDRVMPWQVFIDPLEESYKHLTRAVYKRTQFPVTLLPFKTNTEMDSVTVYTYWNINDGKVVTYIPELDYYKEEKYTQGILPFIFMHYESPIKGTSSSSIVDDLYGIQMEIQDLCNKIRDASQLASPLKYFVPESSTIKTKKLSNRTGEIITYTPSPNMTSSPVTVATDPFMDPQWMTTLEQLKQHAYEICGISQLSATSQKPKGLDSGIALSTMEDIESDRFETQLNEVIRAYVEIAKLCIDIFPEDEDILPPNRLRSSIKWRDIVEAKDSLNIQFSAAESLSKDPSEKLRQLQALYQAGLIPQSRIAQLMELPDLQMGYSISQNSINAVLSVIDDCLENGVMEVPDYIPTQMLKEEIMNTCLSLKANNTDGKNNADISKLLELYKLTIAKETDSMTNTEMATVNQFSGELQEALQPGGQMQQAIQAQVQQAQLNNMNGVIQ